MMKSTFASYLLFFLASALVFLACQTRPREVLNRRAMERLMYDVLVAEAEMGAEFNHFVTPEVQEAFMRDIFRQHGISVAQWEASLDWYADRINIFLQMNDSVMARLAREREIIDAEIARREAWERMINESFYDSYVPRHHAFWMPSQRGGFGFRLDSAEIVARVSYDDFYFRFRAIGIPPTGVPGFRAVLRLEYTDTTLFVVENITENRLFRMPIVRYVERDSLRFAADSIPFDTLRNLSGFVRLPDMRREFRNIQLYDIALDIETECEGLNEVDNEEEMDLGVGGFLWGDPN